MGVCVRSSIWHNWRQLKIENIKALCYWNANKCLCLAFETFGSLLPFLFPGRHSILQIRTFSPVISSFFLLPIYHEFTSSLALFDLSRYPYHCDSNQHHKNLAPRKLVILDHWIFPFSDFHCILSCIQLIDPSNYSVP